MTQYEGGTSGGRELPPTLASTGEDGSASGSGDLVGRILGGRYRILRKLGEGAMGAVYLGEHLKIGRQDAIKVLRDALATDADTIARFVRGTRNVSMIRHPNICTIYDYSDTADGIQFVAMEFVPGETLRDLLQREGKLPLEVAVHIARQAAEALDAAHEVGIVHRDLKPANIMVMPGRGGVFDVKVVDFDIAKGSRDGEGEEVTRMGFVVGTPEYMSPEQLIGDRLDGRSDVYSLGLVLYRMLTGTLPFAAEDTQDLMVKRLTEEPMTLAAGLPGGAFPPALERAIRRSLQRKPAERQTTAHEFAEEISEALGVVRRGEAAAPARSPRGENPPEAAQPPAPKPTSRRVSMLVRAAAAGGALVLLLVAGLLAFGGEDDPPVATTQLPPTTPVVEFDDPVAEAGGAATGSEAEESEPPETFAADASASGGGAETGPAVESAPPPPTEDELYDALVALGTDPPVNALVAARDLAFDAWNHPAASAGERATAAYVASSALTSLGDARQALVWIDRALEIRPDYPGYVTLRNSLVTAAAGN